MLFVPPLVPEASAVIPAGCCSPACGTVPLSHPHCTPLPGHAVHMLCNAATRCSQVEHRKRNEKRSPAWPTSGTDLVPIQQNRQEQWRPQNPGNFFSHSRCMAVHTASTPLGTHTFAARPTLKLRQPHTTFKHQHIFLQLLLKRTWS